MANDSNGEQNISVSVPVGVIAAGAVIGLIAAAAYVMTQRGDTDVSGVAGQAARSGRGFSRKLGLMTLITIIENDATRRVLVALLRAIARRS